MKNILSRQRGTACAKALSREGSIIFKVFRSPLCMIQAEAGV